MRERLEGAEAYAEAREIFQQASTMASLQTRYDLEVAWASDPQGSGTSAPLDPSSLPTQSQVVAFFQEQGLSLAESNALYRELYQPPPQPSQPSSSSSQPVSTPRPAPHTLEMLAAKMIRWRRVLPGIDVARVVAKDCAVLSADLGWAMRCLIMLVERMPRRDVMGMIPKQPRILWSADLPERFERVVSRLVQLHPSGDIDIVLDLLSEHPELLYRLDYYPKATILDDLPIEIQNMMIVADQSLDATIRYYRNRRTNYGAEISGQHLPENRDWQREG